MDNNTLRKRVKEINSLGVSYTSIFKNLGWGSSTLYKWLNGGFDLKEDKLNQLNKYINNNFGKVGE